MAQVHLLQTISEGWAYPLERFMNEQELLESMNMNTIRDKNGDKHLLSVPITQYVTEE
jgi:ATP sulfurylase